MAYFRQYNETIPVAQLVREVATVMQEYTQSGALPSLPSPPLPSIWLGREIDLESCRRWRADESWP